MPGKQAKILSADHIDDLLFFAERSRHPDRNRLIVLLSIKAGLRAAEIAKLTWQMVLGAGGEIGTLNCKSMRPRRVVAGRFRCTKIYDKRFLSCGSHLPLLGRSFAPSAVGP